MMSKILGMILMFSGYMTIFSLFEKTTWYEGFIVLIGVLLSQVGTLVYQKEEK